MRVHSFLSLLFLLLLCSRAEAIFGHALIRCQYTSLDDFVYLEQYYINKMLLVQYTSTSGNYTGYTKRAIDISDQLNKNARAGRQAKRNEEKCKNLIPFTLDALSKSGDFGFSNSVEPSVKLRSVDAAGSKHPGMLVCSVYGFYPKQIRVTWQKNGNNVTSGVTSTEELSNGNWYYQIHSYLEFTPRPGEKITCMVEHASLTGPKLYDWDPINESQRIKFAAGTAGLLLGLVFFVTGLVYYKRNNSGRVLVPTT